MKVLQFTLSGLLAHFKTPYTNSSKLTYDVPTFTAIEGIIGAILGWDKWDYHIKIERDKLLIGIEIIKYIERIILTLNQIDLITPFSKINNKFGVISERTQRPMEHIFKPAYTFYISHRNPEIYEFLKDKILNKKSIYPIYFGSAYCLAEYTEINEFETTDKSEEIKNIITFSVIPEQEDVKIEIDEALNNKNEIRIICENLPYKREKDFTIKEYKKVVYNPEGKGLICSGKFYNINGKEIYLFGD